MEKKIFSLLFSTRLMAFLFIAFALAMAAGTFIEDAYNMTSPYIKENFFSNKNEFVNFIEKMLLLVNYDHNNRLSLEEFVKDSFFTK